jgi:hypothetical protein
MEVEKDKTPPPYSTPKPERLLSLDTYRGFLMLVLATSAFQLHKLADGVRSGPVWNFLSYQFSHPPYRSCSFWDLVQPSFMFMVGVAVPYSVASRRAKGDSQGRIVGHALWRSLILILLGVFISSNNAKQTDWTFVNVLSQIGLGYTFLVLLEGRGLRVQLATLAGILVGYWLCFALYRPPTLLLGVQGFDHHWNLKDNFGMWVDRWFLNRFPRKRALREERRRLRDAEFHPLDGDDAHRGHGRGAPARAATAHGKLKIMLVAGAACFGISILCDPQILPSSTPAGCSARS